MAQSINTIRAGIQTSVHGRRLGLDNDDLLSGPKGIRSVVTAATSATTGTNLPNHGYVTLTSSSALTYTINDPVAGQEVTITLVSSAIPSITITPVAATFISSGSSTGASVVLQGGGTSVTLYGASTSLYGNKGQTPASTYIDFTT